MSTCPCGCGKRVSIFKKGALAGARRIKPIIEDLREIENPDLYTKPLLDESDLLTRRGESIYNQFIDHIHGTAHPRSHHNLLQLSKIMMQWQADVSNYAGRAEKHILGSTDSV